MSSVADESENNTEAEISEQHAPPESATLPFIIVLAALTIYFGFGTLQRLTERSHLTAVKSNQDAAIQEAQKVQAQFKILVGKTSELADQGHAGAKMVMEELLKQGVSAAPEAATPSKTETKAAK